VRLVNEDTRAEVAAVVERVRELAAADLTDPAVEGEARPRTHSDKHSGHKKSHESPQVQGDEPIGPAGKRRPEEKKARPGKPSPEGTREARKSGKIAPARKPGGKKESGAE
jgi:hypothetical protein